jgi:hypothetical protein
MLERVGIYVLVFLSIFHCHIDTPWLRDFCERWNYSTNTLFIDDQDGQVLLDGTVSCDRSPFPDIVVELVYNIGI